MAHPLSKPSEPTKAEVRPIVQQHLVVDDLATNRQVSQVYAVLGLLLGLHQRGAGDVEVLGDVRQVVPNPREGALGVQRSLAYIKRSEGKIPSDLPGE